MIWLDMMSSMNLYEPIKTQKGMNFKELGKSKRGVLFFKCDEPLGKTKGIEGSDSVEIYDMIQYDMSTS